ncbi:MAG: flavin reductase family protein [Pseudomonadota bacterium]
MTDPFRPLKNAFSRFATGITVVSCLPKEGGPIGITVNSFSSVSLEPAMVSWCIDRGSSVSEHFLAANHYAVSILSAGQQDLSNRFATPGNHAMAADEIDTFATGAGLLKGRLAGFDCRIAQRVEVGDHVILIGEIVHFDSADGKPLMYVGRQYTDGPEIVSD